MRKLPENEGLGGGQESQRHPSCAQAGLACFCITSAVGVLVEMKNSESMPASASVSAATWRKERPLWVLRELPV